jgi:hypothetical protein
MIAYGKKKQKKSSSNTFTHLPERLNRGIVAGTLDSRTAQQKGRETDCGDG